MSLLPAGPSFLKCHHCTLFGLSRSSQIYLGETAHLRIQAGKLERE